MSVADINMHLKSTSNIKYILFSLMYSASNVGCPNSPNSVSPIASNSAVSPATTLTYVKITVDTSSLLSITAY